MKKRIVLLLFVHCLVLLNTTIGQVPNAINFMAVAKLSDGTLVKDQSVTVMVQLFQENFNFPLRYSETHDVITNNVGHFNFKIGTGDIVNGNFDSIKWEYGNVMLQLEIDIKGGSSFIPLGAAELLSVPYALYSQSSNSLVSSSDILIDASRDINLKHARDLILGDDINPAFYVNEKGKIGLGTRILDNDKRKDIEMGINKRFWGYSNEWHLDKSGVFNLQAVDSNSKPAIVWYSPEMNRQAAIVAHIKSGGHNDVHNHWSIETTDEKGDLYTRMEFPLDKDWTTIETHYADFKVGDGGELIASGEIFGYGTNKIAFGDKNWSQTGLYGNAKWEFYRATYNSQMLIHQGDGNKFAELLLKSGNNEWKISNKDSLQISYDTVPVMTMLTNGNVGIGISEPTSKLHVDGDIKITAGHSYLTQGADFAEYFQSETDLEEGDIIGVNLENGLARKYQSGDALIGIITANAGFVGNNNESTDSNMKSILVGLVGQLPFNAEQTIIKNGRVYTKDMQKIGILLANGKVFLRM